VKRRLLFGENHRKLGDESEVLVEVEVAQSPSRLPNRRPIAQRIRQKKNSFPGPSRGTLILAPRHNPLKKKRARQQAFKARKTLATLPAIMLVGWHD